MDELRKHIAKSLKQNRVKAGYKTMPKYCDAIGIDYNIYKNYELGRTSLPASTACKIADFLGISLDDLVGREFVNECDITPEETQLLENYRALDDARKNSLQQNASDGAAVSKSGDFECNELVYQLA